MPWSMRVYFVSILYSYRWHLFCVIAVHCSFFWRMYLMLWFIHNAAVQVMTCLSHANIIKHALSILRSLHHHLVACLKKNKKHNTIELNVMHEFIPPTLLYQRLNEGEKSSMQIGLNAYNTIFVLWSLFEIINNYEILVHTKKTSVSLTSSKPTEFCMIAITDLGIQANFHNLSIRHKWGVS